MDAARWSPFPQHSWLGFHVRIDGVEPPLAVHLRGVAHTVSLTTSGRHSIRWIRRGGETQWAEDPGTVHFMPADGEDHAFVTTPEPAFESRVLVIPRRHLWDCVAADGHEPSRELPRILAPFDPVLRSCIARVASPMPSHDRNDAARQDEAARRLVLRLVELGGGGRPDWHADSSTFDRRTLDHLVEYIDAHLRIAPSLADTAVLVGLTPSHFARKFRASTGLSLHRLVNRRRLRAAMGLVAATAAPLAEIALDLGFSSQSHFTRLFSDLTGMTPARYRRQCRPTVG